MRIEVYYTECMNYKSRKWHDFDDKEAEVNFFRTIGKLTQEKKQALVCLRGNDDELVKSEWIKP